MTQNKVLGPFTFLKFVPNIFFWANLAPKLESALFKMKLHTKGYSRLLILNSTIVFLNFISKIPLLGKFGLETSKVFVQNENRYKDVLRGVLYLNSIIVFLSSVPKITLLGKFGSVTVLFQNDTRYKRLSKAADFKSKISFFKSCNYNTFFGQNFKVLCSELNSVQSSIHKYRF